MRSLILGSFVFGAAIAVHSSLIRISSLVLRIADICQTLHFNREGQKNKGRRKADVREHNY